MTSLLIIVPFHLQRRLVTPDGFSVVQRAMHAFHLTCCAIIQMIVVMVVMSSTVITDNTHSGLLKYARFSYNKYKGLWYALI